MKGPVPPRMKEHCFDEESEILQRAIASGRGHGINLVPGRKNPALGNCSFESAVFNVNDRDVFEEKLPMSIDYYRVEWLSIIEDNLFNSEFNPGKTQEQWKEGFRELKKSGNWDLDFFGDMLIPSIVCGLRKTVMLFNTNTRHTKRANYSYQPRILWI